MSTNMMVRLWPKLATQRFIRSLRQNGYIVTGDGYKYECFNGDDLVFCALVGHRGYLCRINKAYVMDLDAPLAVV